MNLASSPGVELFTHCILGVIDKHFQHFVLLCITISINSHLPVRLVQDRQKHVYQYACHGCHEQKEVDGSNDPISVLKLVIVRISADEHSELCSEDFGNARVCLRGASEDEKCNLHEGQERHHEYRRVRDDLVSATCHACCQAGNVYVELEDLQNFYG